MKKEKIMKKMAWITGILTGLMVLLAALGAVGVAVKNIAGDETFYAAQSRQAVMQEGGFASEEEVTAYIGLDPAQQDALGRDLAAYVTGRSDALPSDVLNGNESQHMMDVRAIVTAMANMSRAYLTLAAALAVVTAWTGAKLRKRNLPRLIGALAAVGLLMLIVMNTVNEITAGGFAQMFTAVHEVLFDNDLWLMDPQTDILIRMMPQTLFEQAMLGGANQALRVFLLVWVMLIALHEIVQRMIRRHLSQREAA